MSKLIVTSQSELEVIINASILIILIEAFFMQTQKELIPHLFRTEYRKLTSVLCKLFGIEHEKQNSEKLLTNLVIYFVDV